ncbi:MAG: ABC transporter permease, partial [Anaerolineales bacterium]
MKSSSWKNFQSAAAIILIALLIWESAVHLTKTPPYLLPAPSLILIQLFHNPFYYFNALWVTLGEAIGGLILGVIGGAGVAVGVTLFPRLERGVVTIAILIKSMPLAAIAPLLTIWLGFGILPKVIITALLTFFPVLVNVLVGLQNPEQEMLDL